LEIPEAKMPPGKEILLRCPGCGGRLTVRGPSRASPPQGSAAAWDTREKAIACLKDKQLGARLEAVLQAQGVRLSVILDESLSLETLASEEPFLVLYQDGFDPNEGSGLMAWLASRKGEDRRRLMVVWLGKGVPSGDPLLSFSKSVDLVLDENDVEMLPSFLAQARSERERAHGPLLSVMMELGLGLQRGSTPDSGK
jgi:hypothetical protein